MQYNDSDRIVTVERVSPGKKEGHYFLYSIDIIFVAAVSIVYGGIGPSSFMYSSPCNIVEHLHKMFSQRKLLSLKLH